MIRLLTGSTLAVALLGVLTADLAAQPKKEPKKYALVVGIKSYENSNLPELPYAINDARELGHVLRKSGYKVTLLTDKTGADDDDRKPTKKNIEREILKLLKQTETGDMVLMGFAGHGLQFDDEPYFCPRDTLPFADKKDTMVSLNWIYSQTERCRASKKVILMDACRNVPGRSVLIPPPKGPPTNLGVLFSCASGRRAFDHPSLQHGVFFYYVLKALKGEAADAMNKKGQVTFTSLAEYVGAEVPKKAKELINEDQQPNPSTNFEGTSPILVADATAATALADMVQLNLGQGVLLKLKRIDPAANGPRTIVDPFYMGVTEVTQRQYKQLISKNPSYYSPTGSGKKYLKVKNSDKLLDTSDFPVERVSWNDAMAFCAKASLIADVAGKGWRVDLPTEDEWQYACRAGTTTPFAFGPALTLDKANFFVEDQSLDRTAKVASHVANPWGLYDMHGNVWEWCKDEWQKGRVLRGGSFVDGPSACQYDSRAVDLATKQHESYGFRVVVRVLP